MGNWQQAQTTINKAISLDPKSTFALSLQAWIAINRKQWKEGMFLATKAISNLNNSSQNQEMLSWIYPCCLMGLEYATITTKNPQKIEQRIQEFMMQVPNSSFPYGFKGWKQAQQKLWQPAFSNFQQATNKSNTSRWILLNQAITQEHLNDIQGAIDTYQIYTQQFSENNLVWFNLNQSLIPDAAFVYFRLGTLFGKLQQWQEAQKYLQKAIAFHSEYAEAYHNLGWVLLNIKNSADEIENTRDLLSAYQQAVKLYQKQQKFQEAQQINSSFKLAGISL